MDEQLNGLKRDMRVFIALPMFTYGGCIHVGNIAGKISNPKKTYERQSLRELQKFEGPKEGFVSKKAA